MEKSIFFGEPLAPLELRVMRMSPGAGELLLHSDQGAVRILCQDEHGTPFTFWSRRMVTPASLDAELLERLRRQGIDPRRQEVVTVLGLAIYPGQSPTRNMFRLAFFDRGTETAQYTVVQPKSTVALVKADMRATAA